MLDIEKLKLEEFVDVQNRIQLKNKNKNKTEKVETFLLKNFLGSFESSCNSNNELKISLKTDLHSKEKSKLGFKFYV